MRSFYAYLALGRFNLKNEGDSADVMSKEFVRDRYMNFRYSLFQNQKEAATNILKLHEKYRPIFVTAICFSEG